MNDLMITAMVCIPFALGWFAGRAGRKASVPALEVSTIPQGSNLVLTYPRFLTREQRAAIEVMVRVKLGEQIRVFVLEGGMQLTAAVNPVPMPSPGRKGAAPNANDSLLG